MYKLISFFLITVSVYAEITPIPLTVEYNKVKAELGKKLFFDPILSKDKTISCASCHTLPGSGANSTQFSFGINASEGNLNTPTVLNSVFNFTQFWDGRVKTLHQQALFPLTNPIEMADSVENILNKLSNSPYKKEFKKIYKDGVTQNNLIESIVEFEKALITPNSKFDKYLRGDSTAITAQEKRGYEIFKEAGCISCHNGVNVGGNMFQKVGLMVPYKSGSKGRYNLTLRERDKFVYKVPSLRNIELTAPYLHDGTVQTLRDAIIFMREYQLDIIETDSEVDDIEAFLKTLTGEMPEILKDIK